jgi:DNA-binding CsgD family transcriptional regulator
MAAMTNENASAVAWLLAAVKSLPEEQQDPVMHWLLGRLGDDIKAQSAAPGTPAPTDREQEVLAHVASGLTIEETASALFIAPNTAKNHLQNLSRRLALHTIGEPHFAPALGTADVMTFPVRIPRSDYEALKGWCEQHKFTMAVVVRGLVEQFLKRQASRGQ